MWQYAEGICLPYFQVKYDQGSAHHFIHNGLEADPMNLGRQLINEVHSTY